MKTSLRRRLRGFALHRHSDAKEGRDIRPLAQLDELAKASQVFFINSIVETDCDPLYGSNAKMRLCFICLLIKDMHDMRDCYDSLLSAAAATANSAYEFSESLREMGACLLEKTALNDDEESGKVLLMLGKLQFELQKVVDNYRSHIFQTITSPSESLLNELRIVEAMKRQCDEKRDVYEYMITRQKEKGRSKSGKGETFSMQQLLAAHDEYDDEATLFVFRLKSLKQGQSRSLLTQAARHHAAQLCFFKKALKSLEAVEPHVKSICEEQHIDYHFSGLEDEGNDGDYDEYDEDDDDTEDDGELSFDYGQNDQERDVSTSQNSMELDQAEVTFPQVATWEAAKENLHRSYTKSSVWGDIRTGSQSAPLFVENKSNPAEKLLPMRQSFTRKFSTYVLPTPIDSKNSDSTGSGNPAAPTLKTSLSGRMLNLQHSSPLEPQKFDKTSGDEKLSGSAVLNAQSVLRESNKNAASAGLPPPLADGLLFSRFDPFAASDSKKIKRQAFSGPLTRKPWPTKTIPVEHPQLFSGPILRNPLPQPRSTSPRVSPSASPTFLSSPKISELHELPRPPISSTSKSSRPLGLVGHSAPLVSKRQVPSATNKSVVSNAASPLPKPLKAITRSFSIPCSDSRVKDSEMTEDVGSPSLAPISLSTIQPSSTVSEIIFQTVKIKGTE